jgi:UDP-2,3-diacylglucosamine pyrophosphatase LpxH
MSKIIVTSDQHLGYEHSYVNDFNNFLDYISTRSDVESLVLLGDIVDMWRRDVSGLFLAYSDVVKRLLDLRDSKKINIYIVAGNHDYHLLKLQSQDYKFEFYQELYTSNDAPTAITTKPIENRKYIFKHGWEFDLAQHPLIMEAMCHNMSDEAGQSRSSVYNILQIAKDHFDKDLKEIIEFHDQNNNGYVENLLLPPEQRLKPYLGDVERKAYSSTKEGETLIFGHTHRPFVGSDKTVINTGSWVSEAKFHNTYVELDEKGMKLFQFVNNSNIEDLTKDLSYSFS